jgi:hypothetical protein
VRDDELSVLMVNPRAVNEHEGIAAPTQLIEQFGSVNELFRHRSPCRVSCLLSFLRWGRFLLLTTMYLVPIS